MELKPAVGFKSNRSVALPDRKKAFEVFKNDLTDDWTKAEKNTEEISDDWLIEVSLSGFIDDAKVINLRNIEDDFEDDGYPYSNAA